MGRRDLVNSRLPGASRPQVEVPRHSVLFPAGLLRSHSPPNCWVGTGPEDAGPVSCTAALGVTTSSHSARIVSCPLSRAPSISRTPPSLTGHATGLPADLCGYKTIYNNNLLGRTLFWAPPPIFSILNPQAEAHIRDCCFLHGVSRSTSNISRTWKRKVLGTGFSRLVTLHNCCYKNCHGGGY